MNPKQKYAELVERLRDGCNLQQRDGERAADAIEALIAELDERHAALVRRKAEVKDLQAKCRRWKAHAQGSDRKLTKLQRGQGLSTEYEQMRAKIKNQRAELNRRAETIAAYGSRIGTVEPLLRASVQELETVDVVIDQLRDEKRFDLTDKLRGVVQRLLKNGLYAFPGELFGRYDEKGRPL